MTREERKRDRRFEIAFSALCVLAAMALLCVDASAAYEGAEELDKLTEVLAMIGAGTVAKGITWTAVRLDTPRGQRGRGREQKRRFYYE